MISSNISEQIKQLSAILSRIGSHFVPNFVNMLVSRRFTFLSLLYYNILWVWWLWNYSSYFSVISAPPPKCTHHIYLLQSYVHGSERPISTTLNINRQFGHCAPYVDVVMTLDWILIKMNELKHRHAHLRHTAGDSDHLSLLTLCHGCTIHCHTATHSAYVTG